MSMSSPKIDFFGTFLDTLSSSPSSQSAPTQASPYAPSSRPSSTSADAIGSLSDSIVLSLLKKADAGSSSVPLATLMIDLSQAPSAVLGAVALLQKVGLVSEASDGGFALTENGRLVAKAFKDIKQGAHSE